MRQIAWDRHKSSATVLVAVVHAGRRKLREPVRWLITAIVICSCSAPPPHPEVVRAPEQPIVRDLDTDSLALVAQAAYLEAGTLNIIVEDDSTKSYWTASTDRLFFGKSKARPELPSDNTDSPAIVVITDLPAANWTPQSGVAVPVFDDLRWQQILQAVQASV
ncbi:MAG: hypothetical protein GTO41_07505, partial [Burkholderiales bacterium]|nr:hypothetical protein [Burkholderiales bacterium]